MPAAHNARYAPPLARRAQLRRPQPDLVRLRDNRRYPAAPQGTLCDAAQTAQRADHRRYRYRGRRRALGSRSRRAGPICERSPVGRQGVRARRTDLSCRCWLQTWLGTRHRPARLVPRCFLLLPATPSTTAMQHEETVQRLLDNGHADIARIVLSTPAMLFFLLSPRSGFETESVRKIYGFGLVVYTVLLLLVVLLLGSLF